MAYVFNPPAIPSVPVTGSSDSFPVHRIYCVGRNYVDHAIEMGASGREPPFFFMKPADAIVVVDPGQTVSLPYPTVTSNYHHELELVVALGKGGKDVSVDQAMGLVYGYAVGLDMTRRDLQAQAKQQGRPWCISKGFDYSAPIGHITRAADVPQIASASITLEVNGKVRQSSDISKLIWNVAETIAALSQAWELQAGDLIYSGTPAGVAAVVRGDHLLARVDGLSPIALTVV